MADENSDFYVDDDMEPDPELNRITNDIIGAAIEVHRHLGPGLLECMYEEALCIEFSLRGIPFARQVPIPVTYKGHPLGENKLDLLVAGQVVVELKTVESIAPIHKAQLICYLKLTGRKLGLLINFNVVVLKNGIKRIAN